MFYDFPHLTNIQQVRDAIKAHREGDVEFYEAVRDDVSIFNYTVNLIDTFRDLDVADEQEAFNRKVLRECRGLIFNNRTGKVEARRFQKFFNVGERDETQMHRIDVSVPHVILEKLDGSMISPFKQNGRRYWGTKMGLTDVSAPVNSFVADRQQYEKLAEEMARQGYTPVFEWCSRQQRIVIDYPVDDLVLTAIRHNETGLYIPYGEQVLIARDFDVPVVRALAGNVSNMQEFLEETRGLKGQEGWVIRFENGHMCKVKAEEYLLVHKTKDHLTREKDVVRMVVKDQIDDLKPLLAPEDSRALSKFYDDVHMSIHKKADELFWIVQAAYDNLNGSKKKFAEEVVNNHPVKNERGILFRVWDLLDRDGVDVEGVADHIRGIVANSTSTGPKVDEVRNLFGGVKWYNYFNVVDMDA